MIKVSDLYRATNDGLDIICLYYPQARECAEDRRKKFKLRDERTASATLWLGSSDGAPCWKVTDFGGSSEAMSPIDVAMKEEGLRFGEAILKLAGIFNVSNELSKSVNVPEWVTEPAPEGATDGEAVFEFRDNLSENTLRILGPRVTQDVARELGWSEAVSFGLVKEGQVRLRKSTPTYPILMRRCEREATKTEAASVFYKIYEPLNTDKAFRFSYTPKGCSPGNYVHGLVELVRKYKKYNEAEENSFYTLPENENKVYVEKKLRCCVICSGERDALCVASLGYSPIWLNSETKDWTEAMMRELYKYVEIVYNIPDIDTTGRRRGTALALAHIDVHTIWLPEWLKDYKDHRGNPRKDFRDWAELRDRKADFEQLLNLAYPARFWISQTNKKSGKVTYRLDTVCLHYFLALSGFYTLKGEDGIQRWVRVSGNHVSDIKPKHIRQFLRRWAEERFLERDILNEILNSPRLADSALENLEEVELDFTTYTSTSQRFFVGDKTIEVTAEGIEELDAKKCDTYVWEDNVLPYAFKRLEPMFEASWSPTLTGETAFRIEVKNTQSNLFAYLINTSRLHWRKEMETRFSEEQAHEAEEYCANNRFRIDGEGLDEGEVAEQMQNLASKLFAVGYMLHAYKSPSRAWAPFAMDNKVGENGECNGRSGKSFLFMVLSKILRRVFISGRGGRKALENPHIYKQVNRYTDFIQVDDLDPNVVFDSFYDIITGGLTVNPKNNAIFTLAFEESPKIAFTTNFVPKKFDASTMARLLPLVFSDYYHERTEDNGYLESRSVRDDFGRDLYTKLYSDEEWNADINFMMQCLQFYLRAVAEGHKVLPPMGNIFQRKLLADIEGDFSIWANTFFGEESENLDVHLIKKDVYEDFHSYTGGYTCKISMKSFTIKLRAFCELQPYIVGINLGYKDGKNVGKVDGKSVDRLYITSTKYLKKDDELSEPFRPDEEDCTHLYGRGS